MSTKRDHKKSEEGILISKSNKQSVVIHSNSNTSYKKQVKIMH